MQEIIILQPDDFHTHLREGSALKQVAKCNDVYGRVVAMGNLREAVANATLLNRYRNKILNCNVNFEPLMTLMLVNSTTPEIVSEAYKASARILKLIPGGTSTNSGDGVRLENLREYYPVLEQWQSLPDTVFSIHCELDRNPMIHEDISPLSQEYAAIPYLTELINYFPELKIVVEHASTKVMIDFINIYNYKNLAATLTVHHALLTYNKVCDEKGTIINPYNYCKPIAKHSYDRLAVIKAMISGNPMFFFGSDSAFHPKEKKKLQNGTRPAAGIFTPGEVALSVLAEIFENYGVLDKLENFISKFGAKFYGLPLNEKTITLKKEKWTVPKEVGGAIPFRTGYEMEWQIVK